MHKQQIQASLYQYTLIIIILVALAYRSGREFLFQKNEADITLSLADLREIYPATTNYELNRYGAYDVYDNKNKKTGSALLSSNYSRQFGYAGRVPLLIGINDSLIIDRIVLLKNNETFEYIRAVYEDKFLGNWQNISLEDAMQLKVDVVSGATHTSKAVIAGVRHTASSVLKSDASVITDTNFWAIIKDILFLCLMLFSLVMVFKKGTAKYRTIYMVLVLVIMGLILNNAISAQLLYGWLKDGFAWRANWQTIAIFILALIVSFVGKRKFYCNYLCPMGALQELTNRFSPFKKRRLPVTLKGLSIREVYLTLIAGALLLGFSPELSYAEPFMFFSFRVVGIGLIIFGLIVLLSSLFFTKPWCSVCPTGCLLDTISYQKAKKTKS